MPFDVHPSVSQVAGTQDDNASLSNSSVITFRKDEKVWEFEVYPFDDVPIGNFQIIEMFMNSEGKLVIKFEDGP